MSQVGNCFWLEPPGAQSVVCIPNFWLNLLPPGWVESWPVAFRILLLRAFRSIRTRKQSFTFHPPHALGLMRKVFLTVSCKTAEMVQGTRDTFFPYIPEKAQNHSHSARAHSHPDGHLRSVLPRAGISSDHWPPLLYLWHLGAADALPRIHLHHYRMGGQPPYLLFRPAKLARKAAPIALSLRPVI